MSEKQLPMTDLVLGHYKHVHIGAFVQDIILDGEANIVETCKKHGVDDVLFLEIMELPAFKKEMREIRAIAEASPNALIQLKARLMVERGLEQMYDIVQNGKDKDKIKAMEFLSKIGGTIDTGRVGAGEGDGKPQASGLVLNVNLGGGRLIPPLPEGAPRPLRRVKEIEEVIDVE